MYALIKKLYGTNFPAGQYRRLGSEAVKFRQYLQSKDLTVDNWIKLEKEAKKEISASFEIWKLKNIFKK